VHRGETSGASLRRPRAPEKEVPHTAVPRFLRVCPLVMFRQDPLELCAPSEGRSQGRAGVPRCRCSSLRLAVSGNTSVGWQQTCSWRGSGELSRSRAAASPGVPGEQLEVGGRPM